jgi:phosphatidylinositol alpha-1,6-mannosyltransferase
LDFKPAAGGIAEYTHHLADALSDQGHEVHVLAPEHPDADSFDETAAYPVHRFRPTAETNRLRAIPSMATAIGDLVDEVDPDWLFHNAIDNATHACSWVAWRRGLPVCTMIHGTGVRSRVPTSPSAYDNPASWLIERSRLRQATRRADHVIVPSTYTRDLLVDTGVELEAVTVLSPFRAEDPDRVPEDRQQAVRDRFGVGDRPVIVTISRLVERKGVDTAIEALATVRETVPDAAYVVAGEGPDRERLEGLAAEAGLADAVTFAGFVDEDTKQALYAAADVFVMPNRELADGDVEGFGIVFLEANLHGTPVVGGRSGGAIDAIEHGETGYLVDPTDPDEVAARLVELLNDPEIAQRMGENGRRRIREEMDFEANVRDLVARLTG